MAKTKTQKVTAFSPKPRRKGKPNKKSSKIKSNKNYVKLYRGQGR